MLSNFFGKPLPTGAKKVEDNKKLSPSTYVDTNTYYITKKGAKRYIEQLTYTEIDKIHVVDKNGDVSMETGNPVVCASNKLTVLPFTKILIAQEFNNLKYYPDEKNCKSGTNHYKQTDYGDSYDFYYTENATPTETQQPVPLIGGKRAKSRRQKRRTRKTRKHRKPSKK